MPILPARLALSQVPIRRASQAPTQAQIHLVDQASSQVPIRQRCLAGIPVPILPARLALSQVPIHRASQASTQARIHLVDQVLTQVPLPLQVQALQFHQELQQHCPQKRRTRKLSYEKKVFRS